MNGIIWTLRLSAAGHLAGVLMQAVLAGLFATGDVDMLAWHANNAVLTPALLTVQWGAAVLLWRPGRGPGWPALASTALIAAETVQIGLGTDRSIAMHIPLGTLLFGASALVTVWVWRTPLPRRAES
ncbi:hypothetical protein BJF79_27380 [Actinomadura sp. CNU-125]|uniref:hypothetical protein n=1 Tax=Actinomadura sp. CNU-125 TaxID=1904961 RepID=UPI000959226E|nr:hypothetical protein [Actinomadura sp. CNU-125]OLT38298.1 hypothetical protein BJF79_27380 [Actinomadura sp. CNU-125]